jgi:hypothetical protein
MVKSVLKNRLSFTPPVDQNIKRTYNERLAFKEGVAMVRASGFQRAFGLLVDVAELAVLAALLTMVALVARLLGA